MPGTDIPSNKLWDEEIKKEKNGIDKHKTRL